MVYQRKNFSGGSGGGGARRFGGLGGSLPIKIFFLLDWGEKRKGAGGKSSSESEGREGSTKQRGCCYAMLRESISKSGGAGGEWRATSDG